tara:strand:- start:478 stop:2046 length:1569 start_codon:yes stop_codon:yes gene_type:complete
MKFTKHLLAASVSVAAIIATAPAVFAQEATIVLPSNTVGLTSYNPVTAILTNAASFLIFDRLVEVDAARSYHPHLAESWEEAEDGMSWVFHLKQGVTFHNGVPFNAQTIADWLPLYDGTDNAYYTAAIDSIQVVDEYTVKFVMKHPEPNLLYNLAIMGVPEPKSFVAMGENFGVTETIGTGPYKLESFDIGQQTVLVRNDDYTWGSPVAKNTGPAKFEHLTFREIAEASTAFLELKTGGVDMLLSVPADFVPEVEKQSDLKLVSVPGRELVYMVMNVVKEPFTDIKVREAAALAINQQEILDNIYGGIGQVADTFLISALPEAKVADEYRISFNPDKANALLDEAGWTMGADGVRMKDGQPLEVSLWTQSDSVFRRLSEVVQAQLKAVGISAEIATFDSAMIRDQYKSGEQQVAVRSYVWDNADIVDWFFGGDRLGYPNISMFNDPKAEELRAAAMTGSKSSDERIANFTAYHEYVLSQFPFAPIYQPVVSVGYNTSRISMPEVFDAPGIGSTVLMDMAPVE